MGRCPVEPMLAGLDGCAVAELCSWRDLCETLLEGTEAGTGEGHSSSNEEEAGVERV